MTPITDKIKQVSFDDVISFTMNGKLYSGTVQEVFTKWGEVADKLGNDADTLATENARLVSDLEAKTRALEVYANPENWYQQVSEIDGCPLDAFNAFSGSDGNGYDIAQAALKEAQALWEEDVCCFNNWDVLKAMQTVKARREGGEGK